MKKELIQICLLVWSLVLGIEVSSQRDKEPTYKRGAALYQQHCASCHQSDGKGVTRLIPPLVGTDYVSGDKGRLIRILLQGLNEPIVVQEEEYYSPMASFQHLNDIQLADILSFVRTRFGSGASFVTPKEVQQQRKKLPK
ncbi:MAG: cytochrome c [Bacteroidetes bacterium]|nr:cytochrome c [Bacteroidota bacterium]